MSVSGGSATEVTISGLMRSTTYSVQVAAVNSAGTGSYTSPLMIETPCSKHISYYSTRSQMFLCVSNLFNQCCQAERAKIRTCS